MTGSAGNAFKYSVVQQESQASSQVPLPGERPADWYVFGFAATPLGRFYSSASAKAFARWYDELCESLGGVPPPNSPAPSNFADANVLCRVEWGRNGDVDGLISEQVDALIKDPPRTATERWRNKSNSP